jgi:ketosteroid isomerase-like protein
MSADGYEQAAAVFDSIRCGVRSDQWALPTPCPEWDVQALVNHVAAEDRSGPLGAAEDRQQRAAEYLIHAWDLAVATDRPLRFDEHLMTEVGGWFMAVEERYRRVGAVGPRPPVEHDADPQTRLLAMFGRAEPTDVFSVIDRFGAAFDARDVDAIMRCMTTDCVFESTAPADGERYIGPAEVRRAWTELFAGSTDAQFSTEARFSWGDRATVQWRYEWGGADPGHVRGVDLFRVRDGLVAEKISYVKG